MTHPTRRRARNRLYLIGVLPALLMLLVSGRIGLLLVEESHGLASYEDGEYGAARGSFADNQVLNPFERWLAHFDEGTARHRAGDLDGAVSAYEDALDEDVPSAWVCPVRNNLALAHEQIGDALLESTGRLAAEEEWLAGREALAECLEKEPLTKAEQEADTDQDGVVSEEEAAAAAETAVDTDQDGIVSPEETQAADTDRDGVVSPEEAAAAKQAAEDEAADTDGDGEVSEQEAAAAAQERADADRDGTVSPPESARVIDDRLADKLAGRNPPKTQDPEAAADPDETTAERERRLEERNRRALAERRRQEQREESRQDSRPLPGDPPPKPEW